MIRVVSDNIPEVITLDASSMPTTIKLEIPDDFPTSILLDASHIPEQIKVVGIPDTIELKGHIPTEIVITAPDDLEVPLVYKGGPVPIQFDMKAFGESDDDQPCFAIVPCPKK